MRRRPSTRVTLAFPANRPIQLRYYCPIERRGVRRSTGTHDTREAKRQAKQLEAELMTGSYVRPGEIAWQEFKDRYDREELRHLRPGTRNKANVVLNMVEKIIKPSLLEDVANPDSLMRFRAKFAAGEKSRFGRARSPHTVKSYMTAIIAALNWAAQLGMIHSVPNIPKYKAATKQKAMKGRPITGEEFDRMLEKTPSVVGDSAAASYLYLLRGLWSSGLRLEEAMTLSWDIPGTLQPVWRRNRLPVLCIPGEEQKSGDSEEIPLIHWFSELLQETPIEDRIGWVFNPDSLQSRIGREASSGRPAHGWVGKVIGRIGEAAGIIVEPANERAKKPAKFASAHDLRRACAERMVDAGLDPVLVMRVMRHKDFSTTLKYYYRRNTQKEAARIQTVLGSPVSAVQ